ncbi:MAG TPA: hypothetical protein VGI73_08430 [Solirubrobacterales bacterium]|jgi:hypothetical protein
MLRRRPKILSLSLVVVTALAVSSNVDSVIGKPTASGHHHAPRPNCKTLLPIEKVEEVMGGEVTLEHFGPSDFILNANIPGTEDGTECIYATTEETRNDYGIAGTVSTAFAETPKEWNGYRAAVKKNPGLENTTLVPVELGGGTKAFVLHQGLAQADEPDIYYLYVYTPLHNMFSIHFLSGVTLQTEEGLAKEVAKKLDAEWRASK